MITGSIATEDSVMSAILFKSGMNIRSVRFSCSFIGFRAMLCSGA